MVSGALPPFCFTSCSVSCIALHTRLYDINAY
jgi:hypothetical protein